MKFKPGDIVAYRGPYSLNRSICLLLAIHEDVADVGGMWLYDPVDKTINDWDYVNGKNAKYYERLK